MKKRCIAALVLVSLAWCSVPVALASPMQVRALAAQPSPHSTAHDHSCCPGVHSTFVPPVFVRVEPAGMPCGDEHPCCARQGPDNPPSLPAATKAGRPDGGGLTAALSDHKRDSRTRSTEEIFARNPIQSYSERSTVLRI